MYKATILLLVCFVALSSAGYDLPVTNNFEQPSGITNSSEKPEKNSARELSDASNTNTDTNTDDHLRENMRSDYLSAPLQEIPLLDRMHLSTCDLPDSDDNFTLATPPHMLKFSSKKK